MIGGAGSGASAAGAQPWGAHPVRRLALVFGLVNGLFAALQVAVSSWAAVINQGVSASLYYGVNGVGLNPSIIASWLAPMLVAAYGTCLLGFIVSLWLCWQAGRAAALATGRRGAGAQAGTLVSLLGSAIWIVLSVLAALVLHTDATVAGLAGIVTAAPGHVGPNPPTEIVVLLVQLIAAALFALGFGALAGRIGAGAAHLPPLPPAGATRMGYPAPMPPMPMPWPPPNPPYGPYPPTAYPPRPESYAPPADQAPPASRPPSGANQP